jgi:hypothetical protein
VAEWLRNGLQSNKFVEKLPSGLPKKPAFWPSNPCLSKGDFSVSEVLDRPITRTPARNAPMKTRKVVRRFQTKDSAGRPETIIEYRTSEASDEIRPDRSPAEPVIGQEFETMRGADVERIDEKSFRILSANIIVQVI